MADESSIQPTLPGTDDTDAPLQARVGPIAPGTPIGRYTVLSELGSGGMGVVYKAWDPALDRAVALKLMLAGRFAARRHIARFLKEARAVARLDHPALVAVYDVGVVDERPYFTMEYVDGASLDALLALDDRLDPKRAALIAAAVARGLEHAHAQGVVHRDIKPANVLIDTHDEARVIDFGIARLLEASDEHTRTGQVMGTPAFMPPEQAEGRVAEIGPRSDVYGVGALLYTAFTGQRPRPVSPISPLAPGPGAPPRDLLAICARALAVSPADRYPSAAALAADLERFSRGEPVEAALPGPLRRLGWWFRRRRAVFAATLLAGLVGLGVQAGVAAWRAQQAARVEADRAAAREETAAQRLTETLEEARQLRVGGDPERARALERDATLRIEVQGTRALARFHLERAKAAAARGDTEGALAAASTAYADARADAERVDAVGALAELFINQRDAGALSVLNASLGRRLPLGPEARARFELHDRVFTGHLLDAAHLAETGAPDWAPLLAALGRGTPTAHTVPTIALDFDAPRVWLADVDGDGHRDVWIAQTLLSTRGHPELPPVDWPPLPAPPGTLLRPIDGLPGAFATEGKAPARVMRRRGGGWRTVFADPGSFGTDLAGGDLDGDGRPEIYALLDDRLRILRPGEAPDAPWRAAPVDPALDASGAYVASLAVVELGEPLLLVATQGWSAYDVRLYRARGDGFELAARQQVGWAVSVVAMPDPDGRKRLAISTRTLDVDPRLFHPDDGLARPDGIHIFEWTDAGLEHRATLAQGPGEGRQLQLWYGDVDGDGRGDLVSALAVAGGDVAGAVYRQRPDGWAEPLPLLGLQPHGLVDVDGDGDAELIASEKSSGRLWTLGAGTTPAPVWTVPTLAPAEATGRAAAIEALVALGRLEEALDAWRREIRLARSPTMAAWRAGRIAERLERHAEAAELYRRAADDPAQAAAALRAAADNHRAARQPDAERADLARLVDLPGLDAAERAAAKARMQTIDAALAARVRFTFDGPLDPALRVTVPDRLRLDRAAGVLDIRADVVGESARLPLIRVADRVAFEVDLATPRVEYGGSFTVALVGRTADGREVDLAYLQNSGWGGGSIVYHRLHGGGAGINHLVVRNARLAGTRGHPARIFVEYDFATHAVLLIDRLTGRQQRLSSRPEVVGDDLALVLRHAGRPADSGATIEVRLDTLTLDGARLGPPSDDRLTVAARALAEGRTDRVLEGLDGLDAPAAEALRLAALYDRGDWQAADARVKRHLSSERSREGPFEQFLRGRLRRDPLHFAPLIRSGWGRRADDWFWRVYETGLDKHRDDPDLIQAAAAILIGADDDPPIVADGADPPARLHLWLARAHIRRAAGEIGGARADLGRIEAALRALPEADGEETDLERRRLWTAVRLERASLDVHDDPDAAAALIRVALADAGTPTVTADRIRADPALRRLADRPVWRVVLATADGR